MLRLAWTIAVLILLFAAPLQALDVGDKAPAVEVTEWVSGKGSDPASANGKNVYIVEFWATWCGPCLQTIPHLNEMHESLAAKGLVVMGITREPKAKVAPFVKKHKMEYNVGIDEEGKTHEAYMKGVRGIPHAFIVNRKGIVVWKGHPMQGLEEAVKQVLAGTFDAETARRANELQEQLQEAKNLNEAMAALDQLITLQPANSRNYEIKIHILGRVGSEEKIPAVYAEWAEGCAEDAPGLSALAATLIRQENVELRDPQLALSSARKAVELTGGKDGEMLYILGRVQGDCAMLDAALTTLEKAAAADSGKGKDAIRAAKEHYASLKNLK